MSHRHRRYSKRELLGSLHVDYIMPRRAQGLQPEPLTTQRALPRATFPKEKTISYF